MGLADVIAGIESGGNPTAKNPRSSATGAGQFIDSTWLDLIGRARPDLVQGRDRSSILALRNDPELSKAMIGAYAGENANRLTAAGFDANPGNTYLAHFLGPGGALKTLGANPGASLADILGQTVLSANPFLRGMTAGGLVDWASKKTGGGRNVTARAPPAPATAVVAANTPATPSATQAAPADASPTALAQAFSLPVNSPFASGVTLARRLFG